MPGETARAEPCLDILPRFRLERLRLVVQCFLRRALVFRHCAGIVRFGIARVGAGLTMPRYKVCSKIPYCL